MSRKCNSSRGGHWATNATHLKPYSQWHLFATSASPKHAMLCACLSKLPRQHPMVKKIGLQVFCEARKHDSSKCHVKLMYPWGSFAPSTLWLLLVQSLSIRAANLWTLCLMCWDFLSSCCLWMGKGLPSLGFSVMFKSQLNLCLPFRRQRLEP